MNTISGIEAIARMRKISKIEGAFFRMEHVTWNDKTATTNGLRTVSRCNLRKSLPGEVFSKDSDLYLPYIDLQASKKNQNRMCRRKLIRKVAFPPHFEELKVKWFKDAV